MEMMEQVLAQGVEPGKIGFYTFTRRAAEVAQSRAQERFGFTKRDLPHFRTLHSEAMRQMGLSSSQVLDGERMQDFADWIGERITGRFSMADGLHVGYERGDRMLFMDGLARVRRRTLREQYDEDNDEIDWLAVERFSRGLREYKEANSLVDYTDMLELFSSRGGILDLHTVFIDEAPDLSPLQWAVASHLVGEAKRVVVAGDDDQNIYKWAGADATFFMELEGQVTVLGQSFRVPSAVQRVARGIISRVTRRRPKEWAPRPIEGAVKWASSLEEIDWTGPGVLLLARNQFLLEPVMAELRRAGVLYEYHDRPSVRQSVLDAVVVWERLRGGEAQDVADVRKMYAQMELNVGVKRGHKTLPSVPDGSKLTFEELQQNHGLLAPRDIWHKTLTGISAVERAYMVRCRRNGERFSQPPRVRVGTIHDSKGGERDRVVLLTDMAHRTHLDMYRDPDSEHRVFYVGATRAKEELVVVRPQSSKFYEV